MTDFVEDNYWITYADDNTVQVADVLPDYSYVIVYPSTVEAKLGTRLRDLQRPVLVLHSRMLDEMGMADAGGGERDRHDRVHGDVPAPVVRGPGGNPDHQRGRSGHRLATPTSEADVISEARAATEFAYDTGDRMATGKAPACRVFFNGNTPTQLTSNRVEHVQPRGGVHRLQLWPEHAVDRCRERWHDLRRDGGQSVDRSLSSPYGVAIDSQDRVSSRTRC